MTVTSKQVADWIARMGGSPSRGAIKKLGREIKRDHALAEALWATGQLNARLLAVLILDKKQLTQAYIERLAADLQQHDRKERDTIADWLMANQLMKSKKSSALLETWREHADPSLERLYWYHQARLRWTGQTPPDNTAELLDLIEVRLADAEEGVQWAMNFCAGWIGVFDPTLRDRCIALGERVGLYRGLPVSRGCTPDYLPEFIRIEVAKRA